MNYQNLVRYFANRTRKNLETLRKLQKTGPDTEVYEVTQLINSMLGLLVFPQQTYFDSIPATPLSELASQGWPIPEAEGEYPQAKDLRELLRYLRNAIAHFNLEFLADDRNQITELRLWNTDHRRNQTTWRTSLTIEDIELITEKFIQLLLSE